MIEDITQMYKNELILLISLIINQNPYHYSIQLDFRFVKSKLLI